MLSGPMCAKTPQRDDITFRRSWPACTQETSMADSTPSTRRSPMGDANQCKSGGRSASPGHGRAVSGGQPFRRPVAAECRSQPAGAEPDFQRGDFQGSDHDSVGWRQGRVSCIGRCAGARCVVMPIGPGHQRAHPVRMAGRPFVRPTLSPLTRPWRSDFFMKFLMNALKNCLAASSAPTPMHQAAVAVVWASRRRHKPCPQQLAPLTVPSQSLPGQPARAGPAGAPVETPAPAPAPMAQAVASAPEPAPASTPEPEPALASAVSAASAPPVAPTAADTPQANPVPEAVAPSAPASPPPVMSNPRPPGLAMPARACAHHGEQPDVYRYDPDTPGGGGNSSPAPSQGSDVAAPAAGGTGGASPPKSTLATMTAKMGPPSSTPPATDALNSQIVQAVQLTNAENAAYGPNQVALAPNMMITQASGLVASRQQRTSTAPARWCWPARACC